MITEEDFDAASDAAPEMAFVRLERTFRTAYEKNIEGSDSSGVWDHYTIEYMNHVVAAARALHIELFEIWAIPSAKNTYDTYQSFRHEVDNYTVQVQIAHIRSGPKNSVALDMDEKKYLRAYADAIKGVIDNSSLVPAKKDRLYDKINAFIAELDSERMPLQKFHDVILSLATTGAEAADKLEPAWKWIRLAAELLGARQETEQKKLPPPRKKIEPPKRQIEPPKKARQEMDDDTVLGSRRVHKAPQPAQRPPHRGSAGQAAFRPQESAGSRACYHGRGLRGLRLGNGHERSLARR